MIKYTLHVLNKGKNMNKLLPYEFHVTVEASGTTPDEFRVTCQILGAKALILDLGINNGSLLSDVMTSSTRELPSDQAAFDEVGRLAQGLGLANLNVIRKKIETVPWHEAAPQVQGEVMPGGSYFESHLAIKCDPDEIPVLREAISTREDIPPMHLSRNPFKQAQGGKIIIMTTLRDYTSRYDRFSDMVKESEVAIADLGFKLAKPPITEFALYDSNIHQDDAWMKR
jgi:hypothetical protein